MRRRRGQTIYEEDSPIEHLYRIVSGAAARFVLKPDGRWQIVALLLPKDVFGFGVGGKHCFAAAAVLNDTIVVRYPWARIEMLAGAARSGWWEPAG
jgi:CRP-like cAMP-binding protein